MGASERGRAGEEGSMGAADESGADESGAASEGEGSDDGGGGVLTTAICSMRAEGEGIRCV